MLAVGRRDVKERSPARLHPSVTRALTNMTFIHMSFRSFQSLWSLQTHGLNKTLMLSAGFSTAWNPFSNALSGKA